MRMERRHPGFAHLQRDAALVGFEGPGQFAVHVGVEPHLDLALQRVAGSLVGALGGAAETGGLAENPIERDGGEG